jgi:hypothetical protein
METIGMLSEQEPQPTGQMDQNNQPVLAPSIAPEDFVEDPQFCSTVAQYWLQSEKGRALKKTRPRSYQNVVLWGQAQQSRIPPPPAPVPKASVTVTAKPEDIGPNAAQEVLAASGLTPKGTPVQQVPKLAPQHTEPAAPSGSMPAPAVTPGVMAAPITKPPLQ